LITFKGIYYLNGALVHKQYDFYFNSILTISIENPYPSLPDEQNSYPIAFELAVSYLYLHSPPAEPNRHRYYSRLNHENQWYC
jgi:hypothetical protein